MQALYVNRAPSILEQIQASSDFLRHIRDQRRQPIALTVVTSITEAVASFQSAANQLLPVILATSETDDINALRAALPQAPLLILSENLTAAAALAAGADDFKTFPLYFGHLHARIVRPLRRSTEDGLMTVTFGADRLSFNSAQHQIIASNLKPGAAAPSIISLSENEFRLASLLATQPGETFSRAACMTYIKDQAMTPAQHFTPNKADRHLLWQAIRGVNAKLTAHTGRRFIMTNDCDLLMLAPLGYFEAYRAARLAAASATARLAKRARAALPS